MVCPVEMIAAIGDIRSSADQHGILEEIIGRPIFLEDDDNVLNLSGRKRGVSRLGRTAAAAVCAEQNCSGNGN